MRLRIAICDCEKQSPIESIDKIGKDNNIGIDVVYFSDPKLLIESIVVLKEFYHILLMDININGNHIFDVAREIRKYDKYIRIVFCTKCKDYVFDGYAIGANGYLIKPIDAKKLCDVILRIYDEVCEKKYVIIKKKGEYFKLDFCDIIYIESMKRKIKFVSQDQEVVVYGKLSEYRYQTEKNSFLAPHNSFLVNMNYISRIENGIIYTYNDKIIPISRKIYKSIVKQFLRFLEEN